MSFTISTGRVALLAAGGALLALGACKKKDDGGPDPQPQPQTCYLTSIENNLGKLQLHYNGDNRYIGSGGTGYYEDDSTYIKFDGQSRISEAKILGAEEFSSTYLTYTIEYSGNSIVATGKDELLNVNAQKIELEGTLNHPTGMTIYTYDANNRMWEKGNSYSFSYIDDNLRSVTILDKNKVGVGTAVTTFDNKPNPRRYHLTGMDVRSLVRSSSKNNLQLFDSKYHNSTSKSEYEYTYDGDKVQTAKDKLSGASIVDNYKYTCK